MAWNVPSWSRGHEFEPLSGQTWAVFLSAYFDNPTLSSPPQKNIILLTYFITIEQAKIRGQVLPKDQTLRWKENAGTGYSWSSLCHPLNKLKIKCQKLSGTVRKQDHTMTSHLEFIPVSIPVSLYSLIPIHKGPVPLERIAICECKAFTKLPNRSWFVSICPIIVQHTLSVRRRSLMFADERKWSQRWNLIAPRVLDCPKI